jgi:hypothetical protein
MFMQRLSQLDMSEKWAYFVCWCVLGGPSFLPRDCSRSNKDTLKLHAVFFHVNYTQRSAFKAIIKQNKYQYLKQTYLRERRRLWSLLLAIISLLFSQKAFETYKILKNLIYLQEIIKSRTVCYSAVRRAVVIMKILNWSNQCSLFMTLRYITRSVRMTSHLPTHAQ